MSDGYVIISIDGDNNESAIGLVAFKDGTLKRYSSVIYTNKEYAHRRLAHIKKTDFLKNRLRVVALSYAKKHLLVDEKDSFIDDST